MDKFKPSPEATEEAIALFKRVKTGQDRWFRSQGRVRLSEGIEHERFLARCDWAIMILQENLKKVP